jgi:cyclophilin family peptidyl-prolyl cis-trans isomerase
LNGRRPGARLRALALLALFAIAAGPAGAEDAKPAATTQSKETTLVRIETSKGDIVVALDEKNAPLTTANFLQYVDDGFFDGTVFHRVIPDFMIQGGGFTPDMVQKDTRDPIKNEATNGLANERGTIAMARTNVVDSATAQFFINLKDNAFLNHAGEANYGYAVFGKVVEGLETVDGIASVPTGRRGPHGDVPKEPVLIRSIVRVE